MAAEDRRFAVLGDPDGDRVIAAPEDHGEMARLQREAHQAELGFFCATAAGGCGDRLSAVNGRQRRPYFRHFPGAICGLRETAEVRDWFTHRMIQNALVAWLHDLGFPAAIEQRVGAHARVDVLSANAVIEVQLSAETEISRQERTTKYGKNVTWLFDPLRNITSRDAQLEDEGVVLLVRITHHPRPSSLLDAAPVEIGVRRAYLDGLEARPDQWAALEECGFDPAAGVRPPCLSEVLREVGEVRRAALVREQEAAEAARNRQREAEEAAAHDRERRRVAGAASRDDWRNQVPPGLALVETTAAPPNVLDHPRPTAAQEQLLNELAAVNAKQQGPRPTVFSWADLDAWEARYGMVSNQLRFVLRIHGISMVDSYPELIACADGGWAVGLPEHLVDPAWAVWYRVGCLPSARLEHIADAQVDPDRLAINALQRAGRIDLVNSADIAMYRARVSHSRPDPR